MKTLLLVVSLLHLAWGQSTTLTPESAEDKTEEVLSKTIKALEQGLEFMQQNQHELNLDGVIGTRVVEGQLEMLLQRLQAMPVPRVSVASERRLVELRHKASAVSDAALPSIMVTQPAYYAHIGPIIQKGFWTQRHASRAVNRDLVRAPVTEGEAMKEGDSDDCLTEILGTSGQTTKRCSVSRFCWKLMTSPGYRHYSLSHQLFYMLIAEASGCIPKTSQEEIDELTDEFCANMLLEVEDIARNKFPLERQDLFMEIQTLCGIAGFREFFRPEWLDAILSWQWQPQGCWGKEHTDDGRVAKREERVLGGGCMAHRTAVAVGALSQNIRYVTEVLQNSPPNKHF